MSDAQRVHIYLIIYRALDAFGTVRGKPINYGGFATKARENMIILTIMTLKWFIHFPILQHHVEFHVNYIIKEN